MAIQPAQELGRDWPPADVAADDRHPILRSAEMRQVEIDAMARGDVTGLKLMERAGREVVGALLAEWPDASTGPQRAAVLCGPGNNGGDGFVIARLLRERGWDVRVWLRGDPDRLPPDAAVNHARWIEQGPVTALPSPVPQSTCEGLIGWVGAAGTTCYILDALFGIGLTRSIDDPEDGLTRLLAEVDSFRSKHQPRPRIVAVDVPSGLCADSGRVLRSDASHLTSGALGGHAVRADLTVTFHTLKPGHLLADGPSLCGRVVLADIGLPWPQPRADMLRAVPAPRTEHLAKHVGHKYSYGHALLLAGGCGRGGAARLAARGTLRIGAGLVTLAVPPAALQENAARLDAIMLRPLRDARALSDLLADPRYNAVAIGPGLGTSDREAELLDAVLDAGRGAGDRSAERTAAEPRRVVLDADALTLLARDPNLFGRLHASCVLTPHEGEFARLFPEIAQRWHAPASKGPAYSKVDAARDAARQAGATLLLKGPDTVVADPEGRIAIHAAVHERAAPWLATAGSGDVLAGFIAGLLARGFAPFEAACTAAWLHAECARSFGPGLVAEDLPEELPKVFRSLGL